MAAQHRHSHGHHDHDPGTHGVMSGRIVVPYDLLIGGIVMRWVYPRLAAAVARDLPAGATVLDIGTGPGRFPYALARRRPDLQVIGIDPSADMIARARRRRGPSSVTFVEAGSEALPQASGSVDAVVSSLSSHHWADVDAALAEQARVLKPGGDLWVFDLHRHLDPGLRAAIERAGLRLDDRDGDLGRLAARRFAQLHALR